MRTNTLVNKKTRVLEYIVYINFPSSVDILACHRPNVKYIILFCFTFNYFFFKLIYCYRFTYTIHNST